MSNNQVRRLPVLEDNKLVGILSIGDLARNNDIPTSNVGTTFECICMDF
jgi:CBS domain-containing protein